MSRPAATTVLRAREEPRREVTFRDGRASCRIVETADGVIVEALIDDGAPCDPLGTGNAKVFVVAPDRETARRTVTAMLGVLRSIAELTQSAAESR